MSAPQVSMPRVRLSDTLHLSRIAYGAWRLADHGTPSVADTRALIDACLAQGITTFDHADIYGDHRCEALFGQALKADRSLAARIELVSKCGIMLVSNERPGNRVKHYDTSPEHVRASVERSLSNLGVERLDLLLIHRPDPRMDHEQLGQCLDGLVAQGKVRAVGVSNFRPWDLELLQSGMRQRLVTNQIELNLSHTAPLRDGDVAQAQRLKMPLMAWSPLAGGALLGDGEVAQRVGPLLRRIGQQHGVGPDAVAVAWLLAHPAMIIPVLGSHRLERVQRLADALRVPLDNQTWYELYSAGVGRDVP